MTDMQTIVLITIRLIEAIVLSIVVAGSIYICLDLIFGEKGDRGAAKIIKNSVNAAIFAFIILIFVNVEVINAGLLILVAIAVVAAGLFAFLRGPLKMDEKSRGFWALFVILYTSSLYLIIKEILKFNG